MAYTSVFTGTFIDNRIANMVDIIYPVGSIYLTISSDNPSVLFGGTWQRLEDAFLVGAGNLYSVGATGGGSHMSTLLEVQHSLKPSYLK